MFPSMSNKALALIGVIFLVKLYCVCHLAGHIMHNRWVARSASSKGNTFLVAWFAFGLKYKQGKVLW